MSDIFRHLDISASGMTVNRQWMDAASQNIANANTTRTETGDPYRAKIVSFESVLTQAGNRVANPPSQGVRVSQVADDPAAFPVVYDPGHPDADAKGYVRLSNVNTVQEMTNIITASRSFDANVAAFNANRNMYLKTLDIGRNQ